MEAEKRIIMIVNNFMLQPHEREINNWEGIKRKSSACNW